MTDTILQTKLYIPPTRPNLVPRPHLMEKFNQGVQQGCKLTLISAPAGFGKTTLIAEWGMQIAESTNPNFEIQNPKLCWLSLDESDNDPIRFLSYFIAALQTIDASIAKRALSTLQSPQPPPTEAILTSLINEIATLPDSPSTGSGQSFVLVLDDYHVIDAKPVDDALTFLLEHLPPQMHLVISTRDDPNLPLARLRARGQLTELRAADLRFTSAEAAEFLNQVMGLNLSAEGIAALEGRTEGWIAGLQLAAISMQGHEDVTSLIKSFTGSHRFVLDYLIEEVLEQQSESVQTFLLQTAILDRLTGSLCNALTGQNNDQQTLEYLEHANLFIVPLDNERRWYRYHHLFADLLNHRLRQTFPDKISELHLRASEWYEQKELPSDAIRHALAAEDFERAAGLAELVWSSMQEGYQSITWLGWVTVLPEELVRARPVLCVAYAQALLNAGKLEAAEAKLLDAERACPELAEGWLQPATDMSDRPQAPSTRTSPEPPAPNLSRGSRRMVVVDEEQFRSLPVSLATARAYHAQASGDLSGTVKYTRQILDLLPEGDRQWRGAASSLLGLAQYASGELEAAHRAFSDGLAGMDPLDAITGAFVLADIKMALGQLRAATSIYEHALQLAVDHGEPMPPGTEDVYIGISKLHREQGDLEAAAQDLLTGGKLGEQVKLPDWQHRWCIAQARLKETRGDLDGALDLLDEAGRLYVRTPVPDVRPIAALKAQIWVAQGSLAEALAWARGRGLSVDDDLSYLREFEHMTLARVLIAQYKSGRVDGSIQETVGLIERLLQAAEEGGRTGSVIEILVLLSLAHEAQGDISPALASLERVLTLAESKGYVQIFVDEGPPMARLLYEALSQGIAPDYVRQLLTTYPIDKPKQVAASQTQSPKSELIEPLSEREIEVLQLIAEGLTNREIASRLYLSLNTVKVHTRNIYGKLGVHHRAAAVARARILGILPST